MIEHYSFGRIKVEGETFKNDIIILPSRIIPNWWRTEGHSLHPEDLSAIENTDIETFIMGCGKYGVLRIPESTRKWFEEKDIHLISGKTDEAVETFNRLKQEKKKIAAGFHLTC